MDYTERKLDYDFYNGIEDRSLRFEFGTFRCLALIASHTGEVSTKTIHWDDAESDDVYSFQETYY